MGREASEPAKVETCQSGAKMDQQCYAQLSGNTAAWKQTTSLAPVALACARDAHRSRRTLLAPARVLVAVAVTTGSVARLAFAAAASAVIGARWVGKLKLLLRRRVVGGRGIGRYSLGLTLNVPYRRLLRPRRRLVRVGVDVGDDGSGGLGVAGGVVVFRPSWRRIGGLFCDYGAVCGGPANVAVAFEDLFGGDVGAVVEEGGIVEDGLKIFRDL